MKEPPEAPNVSEVSSEDFSLDDLGALDVSDEVVELTRKRIREELRKQWPTATGDDIEEAASQMEPVQFRALAFGVVNYRTAYEVGARVAETLQHRLTEAG